MTTVGFYPAQQGVDAHGVLLLVRNKDMLEITTDAGESITPIWLPMANITSVSSPKMSKTFHDVTPSIPGAWKQVVPGFKDAGTVSMMVLFNSELGSHSYLLNSYKTDSKESFRLWIPARDADVGGEYVDVPLDQPEAEGSVFLATPDATFWEFDGYVSGISTSHSAGGIIIGNLNLRLTGPVKFESLARGSDWPGVETE